MTAKHAQKALEVPTAPLATLALAHAPTALLEMVFPQPEFARPAQVITGALGLLLAVHAVLEQDSLFVIIATQRMDTAPNAKLEMVSLQSQELALHALATITALAQLSVLQDLITVIPMSKQLGDAPNAAVDSDLTTRQALALLAWLVAAVNAMLTLVSALFALLGMDSIR